MGCRALQARRRARGVVVVMSAAVLLGACSIGAQGTDPQRADPGPVVSQPGQSTDSAEPSKPTIKRTEIVAVGDIACDPTSPVFADPNYCRHEAVARLTKKLVNDGAEWFIPLGDIQYESGTLDAFNAVYGRWFGQFRSISMPVAGNHEWYTDGAAGYFAYFGKRAGTPEAPWRSFSPVKGWRVYLLDSNCENVGGCGPDSPQGRWLAKEVKNSGEQCSIAAWHHPLHTSGEYEGDAATIARAKPLWELADASGVDVVLNGHDHIYERFAPIDGMTQFTVGTGGKESYDIGAKADRSRFSLDGHIGVLRLTLASDGTYDYAFIDASNDKVLDAGTQTCMNGPAMP